MSEIAKTDQNPSFWDTKQKEIISHNFLSNLLTSCGGLYRVREQPRNPKDHQNALLGSGFREFSWSLIPVIPSKILECQHIYILLNTYMKQTTKLVMFPQMFQHSTRNAIPVAPGKCISTCCQLPREWQKKKYVGRWRHAQWSHTISA